MRDELLRSDEIYLQDIICDAVLVNPKAEDFQIYNHVVQMYDVECFETAIRILELIKINKYALMDMGQ